MVRATTPTFELTIPDSVDLTTAERIVFSLAQDSLQIDKEGEDIVIDGNVVSVYLTQEETLNLSVGTAQIQLNWSYPTGKRMCSEIVRISITDNLFNEVM